MNVVNTHAGAAPSKGLHIALWIAQVLLALAFGMAGAMKTFTPIDELVKNMPWVSSAPLLPRFIGLAELCGALGMVLPSVTRIRPVLTPLAALGLLIIMVLATGMHIVRGELHAVPVNILTSSKQDEDVIGSYSLGVNAYVRKPVEFKQFANAVRMLGLFWLVLNEPLSRPPPLGEPAR
jgi:putative oxidoreductase